LRLVFLNQKTISLISNYNTVNILWSSNQNKMCKVFCMYSESRITRITRITRIRHLHEIVLLMLRYSCAKTVDREVLSAKPRILSKPGFSGKYFCD